MKCKYHNCKNEVVIGIHKHKQFCCNKCKNKYCVTKRRKQIKAMAVEYKGGKCEKCGYNKCIMALHFHHRNPAEKSFAISNEPHTRSWARTKAEVDKCDLLCANCHSEVEYELYSHN